MREGTQTLINKAARDNTDYVLLSVVGILVAIGLVMVYSASFVEAFTLHQTQFYYLFRQALGAVIGTSGLVIAWRTDYRIWRQFSIHFMIATLALLSLVLVLPESMTMVNESRSWIRLQGGFFSIQPSEIAKLAMIIYFADWLSKRGDTVRKVNNVTYGLIPFALMLGLVCILIYWQPDLGTMVTIVMIASVIYFAAGANLWHVLGAGALVAMMAWSFVTAVGSSNGRLLAFQNPWDYYHSFGYQPIHALYALGSGGIFGVGLGQARQKFQWLPQAHTDSIFAIIGEEFGLIGTLLVLIAFGLIAYRGYRIACRTTDPFAALVVVGITSWLVFQALLNIAVTTSLVPFTGLTLPFISYGSTSLIMCMVATGVMLSISRHMDQTQLQEEPPDDAPIYQRSPALVGVFQRTRQAVAVLPKWGRDWWARLPSTGRSRSPEPGPRPVSKRKARWTPAQRNTRKAASSRKRRPITTRR